MRILHLKRMWQLLDLPKLYHVTSAHAKISMSAGQIPRLPSCAPASHGGVGPMHAQFNGCSVVIYQGNSTPSAPPALSRPTLPHTWDGDELQDLDMD